MIVNLEMCNGCKNCIIACKDEFVGNEYLPYSVSQPDTGHFWMQVDEKERGQLPRVKVSYTPRTCMLCEDAPCMKAAKESGVEGAVYRREDGIIIIDPVKARGNRKISESCPYGVIYWNEERQVAQKCTFCAHRTEKRMVPRCVESCPTDALIFGDMDDMKSEISAVTKNSAVMNLRPEFGISTRVNYIGLPKTFLAGSVFLDDTDECAEGAIVSAKELSNGAVRSAKTNNYGDFELEGLVSGKTYELMIESQGYEPKVMQVKLDDGTFAGDIKLTRSR